MTALRQKAMDMLNSLPDDEKVSQVISFMISLGEKPNDETVEALHEAERIAKDPFVKGYNDIDELFTELDA